MSEEINTEKTEDESEVQELNYDVIIKNNQQKTVFLNVFEIEVTDKETGVMTPLIYTRYHNESSVVPGIPEALPAKYSTSDLNGNSEVYTPEDNYNMLLSIETSINQYVELNNEKLKQGALALANAEDNTKNDNEN